MKNIIIILFTIILGITIGNTYLIGDTGSIKSGAKTIVDKAITKVEGIQ